MISKDQLKRKGILVERINSDEIVLWWNRTRKEFQNEKQEILYLIQELFIILLKKDLKVYDISLAKYKRIQVVYKVEITE